MAGGHLSAAEEVADWLYPAEQRIRKGELSAKFRDRPRRRRRLAFRSPEVGPGMPTLADAIPPGPFLGDTIYIPQNVADAFDLNAIMVGNLAQTKAGPLSAKACTPFASLRLNDWCPPGSPVRIRATNVSDRPAAFHCTLEGDEPVDDDAEVQIYAATDFGERVLALRRSLNDHAAPIEPLAREAWALFTEAGRQTQARWLSLELNAYTMHTEARSLHEVLSLPPGDRLVVQVKMYRVQAGQLAEGPMAGKGVSFPHFFVESIAQLVEAQKRAHATGASTILLEFPESSYRPIAGTFPVDVFDRILLGLRAVLHLQLGSV